MTKETAAYEYLRRHGPSPMTDMPVDKLSVRDKQAGIWKFGGNWSTQNATRTGGQTVPVFYIRHLHQPRHVVRAWIHANPKAVMNLPKRSLVNVLNRNGSEFADPIQTLVGEAKG